MATPQANARWKAKQRAKGLCIECAESATPGTVRCHRHHERNRAFVKANYWKRQARRT